MISTKSELKECLKLEAQLHGIKHFWRQYISGDEYARIYSFLWVIRHLEYYKYRINTPPYLNTWYKAIYFILYVWHRHQRIRFGLHIAPGDAEPGLHITALGFIRAYGIAKFGKNTSLSPMTLFGKRTPNLGEGHLIHVGDNCSFGARVTVLAPCKIGNNVTITDGSVVNLTEIPDNATVSGVPAKIIEQ